MENLRIYGRAPFKVAVLHGGPGAPGEMAPVAKELARFCGILEPLQTKDSINGQIQELKEIIEQHGELPITLIGWSWGAWLGWIFAARYPALVKKLILVGSGPFEEHYTKQLRETRLSRLTPEEQIQRQQVFDPQASNKDELFARLEKLTKKTDTYAALPLSLEGEKIKPQFAIYNGVWPEAAALRKSGELLTYGKLILCPVIAIHGDYDPHPAEGVEKTLKSVLKNFKFVLLKQCGHTPWTEKAAKDKFYEILEKELRE